MSAVYFSIGIILLGLIIQISGKRGEGRFQKWSKVLFYASAGAVFLYYVILTVGQYLVWKTSGPPFSYLLPPHESVFYLLNHHFIRFGLYYLVSFIVALLFVYFAGKYNKKMDNRFFEDEEIYFGAISILLLGNPAWYWGWVWYLALMFLGSAAISFVREKFFGIKERMPLYNLWFPTAILVIIISVII